MYNLSIYDLSEQQRLVWKSSEDDIKMCIVKGKDEEACQNYIRVLVATQPGKLLICGTNAFRPMCSYYLINNNNYTLENTKNGQAVCPYDPKHNSTAIYTGTWRTSYSRTIVDFINRFR